MFFSGVARAADTPVILVVGDSLSAGYGIDQTQGWVQLLQHKLDTLEQHYRVVNASISGDTSHGGLQRLPRILKKWKPRIVIIELGGNDGLRGLSLKSMTGNLEKMIQLSHQSEAKVLLLGIRLPANYGRCYGERFSSIYPVLAKKYDVPLVPFMLESVADKKSLMQVDGIHPRAAAQSIVLGTVFEYLRPLL